MRILVIEDERQLAGHVTRALTRHGHCLTAAYDGLEGVQAALNDPPDLVLLDLNLPGLDGLSVLARLREAQCTARLLILTARGEVEHRVKGLHAGADDYLTKPFSMDELLARIEALGRRSTTTAPAAFLKVSDLHKDVRHRRVTRGGRAIPLSPRDFDVLQVLAKNPVVNFVHARHSGPSLMAALFRTLSLRVWQSFWRRDVSLGDCSAARRAPMCRY